MDSSEYLTFYEKHRAKIGTPRHSRPGAAVCVVSAIALIGIGIGWLQFLQSQDPHLYATQWLIAFLLMPIGVYLFAIGYRLGKPDALDILKSGRRPILYLGSFLLCPKVREHILQHIHTGIFIL